MVRKLLGRHSAGFFSLVWLFSFAAGRTALAENEDFKLPALSRTGAWHKLLHYRPGLLRGPRSEADGPKFFLDPEGRSSPEREITANVQAMSAATAPTLGDEDPRCRFPARYQWLRKELGAFDSHVAAPQCAAYEKYKQLLDAKSASIVFSSYYLNNPASAFGHTFLRLGKNETPADGEKYELLDFGVNYSATVTTPNPVVYALNGLFGGFQGVFTRVPYFYKVREYNDFESRDLWQYELALQPEEIERLVAHLWELGQTYFDYYYLDENCSYHVLSLLEAATLKLDLLEHLPNVVVPSDTVRVLAEQPGLISRVRYRPSLRRTFATRVDELNGHERGVLERLLASHEASTTELEQLPRERKVAVLDAAADFVEFRHFRDLVDKPKGPFGEWKQKLLVARASVPVRSPAAAPKATDDERPERGHRSGRIGLEGGYREDIGALGALSYRLALHDLLDPVPGYPQDAQIEFLRARLVYLQRPRRFEMGEFTLFRVVSLSPWTPFAKPLSWHVRAGLDRIEDGDCQGCYSGVLDVGGGSAMRLTNKIDFAAFLDTGGNFTSRLRAFARFGVGPSGLLRYRVTPRIALLAEAGARYLILSDIKWGWRFSAGARAEVLTNVALEARMLRTPWRSEAVGALYYYW